MLKDHAVNGHEERRECTTNSETRRPPVIGKSGNAGQQLARLPVFFCDFSRQSLAYPPFEIRHSLFGVLLFRRRIWQMTRSA
jgi:hypothetical protein